MGKAVHGNHAFAHLREHSFSVFGDAKRSFWYSFLAMGAALGCGYGTNSSRYR